MSPFIGTRIWQWVGAVEGAKCAIRLLLAYALCLFFFELHTILSPLPAYSVAWLIDPTSLSLTPAMYLETLHAALTTTFFFSLFISGIFSIPILLIGLLSGVALGWLLSRFDIALYPKLCLLAGGIFGVSIALIVNIIALMSLSDNITPDVYWLSIGVPSFVYIGACLWLSQRLPVLVERAHAKEYPVTVPT